MPSLGVGWLRRSGLMGGRLIDKFDHRRRGRVETLDVEGSDTDVGPGKER